MCGIGGRRRPAASVGRWVAAALATIAASTGTEPAVAGQLRELAREATPLVLKDGRIAHVAIWAVPFRPGASDLEPEVERELAGLVETLATDCFLTAQAIGHVEPEAAKAGESLTAHRLARARADRIQKAMVERGLQASAIASVWDWQFLVKEPRVTVWVFRLHEGEDCEGKRLDRPAAATTGGAPSGARELPVRSAGAGALAERPSAERKPGPAMERVADEASPALPDTAARTAGATEPADGSAKGAPATSVPGSKPPPKPLVPARAAASLPGASAAADEVVASSAAARTAATASEQPPAAEAPVRARAEARPASGGSAAVQRPSPPTDAGPPSGSTSGSPAAAEGGAKPAAATLAAVVPPSATPSASSLEIVFDVNSSYLPKGAKTELRKFLEGLPTGGKVRLEIVGAVGGADVKRARGADSLRYNRWLAERRVGRVADWLEQNARGRQLEFVRGYVEDDPSRRVTVRLLSGS